MNAAASFSIVSPVYRAENIARQLVAEITASIETITNDYEIILVDDGSPDKSWDVMEEIASGNPKVRAIKLSRNFGQHYAITAGLDHAKGDWIIVMDCDLQDRPEEFSKLYSKAREGFDIVLARREVRQDKFIKRLFSKLFYSVLTYLTQTTQDPAVANFGIYSRKAIQAVTSMREPVRYFPTMVRWVGFKRASINVDHGSREDGKSTYTFKRLLRLAMDIMLTNSDKPIKLTIKIGFTVACLSFVFGLVTLYRYMRGEISVLGYTSLLISIWFLSGLILMVLGVVGLYVGKTFEGVKQRPIYVTDKVIN